MSTDTLWRAVCAIALGASACATKPAPHPR